MALSKVLNMMQWDQCIRLVGTDKEHAQAWAGRAVTLGSGKNTFQGVQGLPIHEACALGAPAKVIDALARAFPVGLTKKELRMKKLPIHLACQRRPVNPRVVTMLSKYFANGLLEADSKGRIPLHYALENRAPDEVVFYMLQLRPSLAKAEDKKGVVPLHVACGCGASTAVIKMLLELHPEATVMVTNSGLTVFQWCKQSQAPNQAEVLAMLQHFRKEVDEKFRVARQPTSRRLLV